MAEPARYNLVVSSGVAEKYAFRARCSAFSMVHGFAELLVMAAEEVAGKSDVKSIDAKINIETDFFNMLKYYI